MSGKKNKHVPLYKRLKVFVYIELIQTMLVNDGHRISLQPHI